MAFKKTTIVLLPEGVRTVKQYKIPKFLIRFFFLFCLCSVAFVGYVFYEYYNLRNQLPERIKLLEENNQQRLQLAALAQKIDHINNKLAELKKVDDKLKVMVNLEPGDDNIQFQLTA